MLLESGLEIRDRASFGGASVINLAQSVLTWTNSDSISGSVVEEAMSSLAGSLSTGSFAAGAVAVS
jgi:hypothetical protein